jgi:hypothetical protein
VLEATGNKRHFEPHLQSLSTRAIRKASAGSYRAVCLMEADGGEEEES